MKRQALLDELAERIAAVERPHPTRVAIDGVDGAGKTMLADELTQPVRRRGREVIRASIDGFHHPREIRYRRGRSSPEGYYRDSFDSETIISLLLRPLGPGGDLGYRPMAFDYLSDGPVRVPEASAHPRAVLLFDGVFLLRPELRAHWDYTIFLKTGFDVSGARSESRAFRLFGTPALEHRRQAARYEGGQRLYLSECRPGSVADVVIDNDDLDHPIIVRG